MKAIVQRVSEASVRAGGEEVAAIGRGLLVLLGVEAGDTQAAADRMAERLAALRVFEDEDGRMNRSVADAGGEILVVPNFTVAADTRKGTRPSFATAAAPALAAPLFERVRDRAGAAGGRFGARMDVRLANDGPVTLIVET